jgi:hypothetical protein
MKPIHIIALVFLCLSSCRDSPKGDPEILEYLKVKPLISEFSIEGKEVVSSRYTYSLGGWGIIELGNIRIAFKNIALSGATRSGVTLATEHDPTGEISSTGLGETEFITKSISGGSECSFAGLTFKVIDSNLYIKDKVLSAIEQPKLIVIDEDLELADQFLITPNETR